MANSKAENEVSVINVVVKAVRVYSTGDNVRYRVQFNSPFQGYAKDMNGDYNLTEIDYIDFVPSVLIAQCLNIVEGLDILYTKKKEAGLRSNGVTGFGAAELQAVLRNAKCNLNVNISVLAKNMSQLMVKFVLTNMMAILLLS